MNTTSKRCDCDHRIAYTVAEAAVSLGISERSVRALVASEKLRSSLVAGRRLIPAVALHELLTAGAAPIGAAS